MNTGGRRVMRFLLGVLMIVAVAATALQAQRQRVWGGFYGRTPPKFATAASFDGSFNFCRVMFNSNRREKQGWSTDYPGADINFSVRLAELTKVRVKMTHDGEEQVPDAVVVRLTDDTLFQCPFIFMEDAGTISLSDIEVTRLREYLLKGGFLFASDYHGTRAREQFAEQIGRALPPSEYPILDITPPHDHPVWNMLLPVTKIVQLASIQTWRRTGGGTIERWNDDGGPPTVYGISDKQGRLMVMTIHDSDIPDAWEREAEDPQYFYSFSPDAYAIGMDMLLYSMTH
jgi:hypothetical protein